MGIIPAIDISNKKCVRLKQGLKGTDKVYFEKPSDAAEFWKKQGARSLHVVDLDGAFEGKIQNIDCLREIASEGLRVQFGGGIRSVEDAALVFEAGAKKIVVGTKLLSENAFEIFKQFEGKVIAAVDCKDGKVCTEGWVKKSSVGAVEAAKLAEKLGASSVL
ncbi:MAG: HisA/HisF-related TIM barrel protein, partial [Candidatus Micrarchaeia archaeon]